MSARVEVFGRVASSPSVIASVIASFSVGDGETTTLELPAALGGATRAVRVTVLPSSQPRSVASYSDDELLEELRSRLEDRVEREYGDDLGWDL